MGKPLVAIIGPTGSGKTGLAITLAKKYGGEIICADSRTIYKGMDIGTAKPNLEGREGVPHYMLDIIEPGERYTIYEFKKEVLKLIDEIRGRGRIPFLVGGSGLYIYTIIFDYDFNKKTRRDKLITQCVAVGIDVNSTTLQSRLEKRAREMVENGVVKETCSLIEKYGKNCPQLRKNAYGEVQKYLSGDLESEDELIERIAIVDRQLAKKQRTWFRQLHEQINWAPIEEANTFLIKKLDELEK